MELSTLDEQFAKLVKQGRNLVAFDNKYPEYTNLERENPTISRIRELSYQARVWDSELIRLYLVNTKYSATEAATVTESQEYCMQVSDILMQIRQLLDTIDIFRKLKLITRLALACAAPYVPIELILYASEHGIANVDTKCNNASTVDMVTMVFNTEEQAKSFYDQAVARVDKKYVVLDKCIVRLTVIRHN